MKNSLLVAFSLLLLGVLLSFISTPRHEYRETKIDKSAGTVTQTRDTRDFSGIEASMGIDVEVTRADNFSITVTADSKVIDLIATDVSDGILQITYKGIDPIHIPAHATKVTVACPALESLRATSAAKIEINEGFTGQELMLDATSAAKISGSINYETIAINVTSAASMELAGKCNDCNVDITSAAKAKLQKLECVNMDVEATSAAKASVNTSDTLIAQATSGAVIVYYGTPKDIDKDASSGGIIKQG